MFYKKKINEYKEDFIEDMKNIIHFRNSHDLLEIIRANIHHIPEFDLIVAIPRSGLIPATYISLIRNLPITDINGLLNRELFSSGHIFKNDISLFDKGKDLRVLVVDDSINTASQMKKIKTILSNLEYNISYLSVFVLHRSKEEVDFYFEITPEKRIFEWNLLNSWIYDFASVDMDGVLCVDPSRETWGNEQKYIEFLKNATPLFLPPKDRVINEIVTARLEKYRDLTIAWLDKHEVKYNKLIMMNKTKEDRDIYKPHAIYKANHYNNSDSLLFIESSIWQAEIINRMTGRPVFCVDKMKMLDYTTWRGKLRYKTNDIQQKMLKKIKKLI